MRNDQALHQGVMGGAVPGHWMNSVETYLVNPLLILKVELVFEPL